MDASFKTCLFGGFDREDVIARCVAHKRDIVAEDEFENGRRRLLNLGHTVGHAVEKCSGYTVSHGAAAFAKARLGQAVRIHVSWCQSPD